MLHPPCWLLRKFFLCDLSQRWRLYSDGAPSARLVPLVRPRRAVRSSPSQVHPESVLSDHSTCLVGESCYGARTSGRQPAKQRHKPAKDSLRLLVSYRTLARLPADRLLRGQRDAPSNSCDPEASDRSPSPSVLGHTRVSRATLRQRAQTSAHSAQHQKQIRWPTSAPTA